MRRVILTMLFVLGTTATSSAQDRVRELDVMAGWAGFPDESMIQHGAAGAALRFPVNRRLSLGPEITFMIGPGRDRDLFVDLLGTVDLGRVDPEGRRAVTPYVSFCGGVLFHRSRFPHIRDWSRTPSLAAGAGLRARINDRWKAGAESRIGMRGIELSGVLTYALR